MNLSSRQITIFCTIMTIDSTLISVQSQVLGHAKQQSWIAHLLAGGIILVSVICLLRTLARFQNKDLFQALVDRFPVLGRGIALMYVGYFFYLLTRDLRMVVDFTKITLLPITPLIVLTILVVSTCVYLTWGGFIGLSRIGELYGPILFFVIASLPVFLARDMDITLAQPFSEFDWPGISKATWFLLPYIGETTAFAFIATSQKGITKAVMKGYFMGLLLLITLIMTMMMVLGIELGSQMIYPNYEVVRHIRLTDFLDRLDLPIVGLWLPSLLVKICFSYFIVCNGLKRVIPHSSGQSFIIPIGFLVISTSYWLFDNAIQMLEFNKMWPTFGMIFQFALPIVFFFILKPSNIRKRGTS